MSYKIYKNPGFPVYSYDLGMGFFHHQSYEFSGGGEGILRVGFTYMSFSFGRIPHLANGP